MKGEKVACSVANADLNARPPRRLSVTSRTSAKAARKGGDRRGVAVRQPPSDVAPSTAGATGAILATALAGNPADPAVPGRVLLPPARGGQARTLSFYGFGR